MITKDYENLLNKFKQSLDIDHVRDKKHLKTLLVSINSKYIHPGIGVHQLYANSIHDVDYIEFTIKDDINKIIDYITNYNCEAVGLSVYIWNIEIIKLILSKVNNKIIILGGPEASYNLSLIDREITFIIKGEGEESFNELISYLKGDLPINKVSNLYYYENDIIKYTYNKNPNLNNIKHDLSLIGDYKNKICYLESSRGCYFNCSYCLASTEKPVRFFPLEEVKANILFLLNNNAKIIKFLDRSFNINKLYTLEILKFIKEHDNGITTFQFEVVGDHFDDEVIDLINSLRPKMIRFEIGIQTTNKETTKAILRKQDFNLLRDNINKIKDNIVIHTDLIAGLPYEDLNSFKKSFNETFLLFTEELQLGFLKELKGTHISNTKDIHDYEFQDTSPYEVIKNKYITNEELQIIKYVELGVDRFYNRGEFPRLMNYLFKVLKLNPFETFYQSLKFITKDCPLSSYQVPDLTNILYKSLCPLVPDVDELFYVIKKDYLSRTNIKPKIFWNPNITKPTRKIVYEYVSNTYKVNINTLYGHAHIDKLETDTYNLYFIINYKDNKQYEVKIDK